MNEQNSEINNDYKEALAANVVYALKTVVDPEIPVNIYDLGLIYSIDIDDEGNVSIQMTLTTPGCPVAHTFPIMIEQALLPVEGVNEVNVILVWDPPWTTDRMSDLAKLELNMF